MLRSLYRKQMQRVDQLSQAIDIRKTWIAESLAISQRLRNSDLREWSQEERRAFDHFWIDSYGQKVSPRWHKLYEHVTGRADNRYIPDLLYSTRIEPVLNPFKYAQVLSDKSLTELMYADHNSVVVPKTNLVNCSGVYYDSNRTIIGRDDARAILAHAGDSIAKPISGSSSGQGIQLLDMRNGLDLRTGRSAHGLLEELSQNFIVQSRVVPHSAWARLHPASLNTVRITTYVADESVHHWPIALRVGTGGSFVDNIHAGGLFVGVTDGGIINETAYDTEYSRYQRHPQTGLPFEGYELPHLDRVISAAHALHGRTPHLGVISWDFAVDAQGQAVLIEVNLKGQSVWIPQITHGRSAFGVHTEEILTLARNRRVREVG